jgi:multidrug resistance efflux pump
VPLPTRAITPRTTIAAEGALALATPPLQLSFDVRARVVRVNVTPGQAVKTGDVLAELDASQLEDALQQASDQFALAEAQAGQSLAPALQTDLDSAKAALSSALARYTELKNGPSPGEIEQALRNWNQSKNSLYSAQIARDVECDWSGKPDSQKITIDDPDCKNAQYTVSSAELNEDVARMRYEDTQQPPGRDELAQAWADVSSAQANLARLEAGASPEQRRVSDVQLEQSRMAMRRAERNLAKSRLISPCDCTVQQVDIVPGAVSAPGTTAVTLLRLDNIRFRTSNLSERDIVEVRAGATASVHLRAYDRMFAGRVRAILPQSSGTQGSNALFTVIVELDPAGEVLLPGMLGEAEIEVVP